MNSAVWRSILTKRIARVRICVPSLISGISLESLTPGMPFPICLTSLTIHPVALSLALNTIHSMALKQVQQENGHYPRSKAVIAGRSELCSWELIANIPNHLPCSIFVSAILGFDPTLFCFQNPEVRKSESK